MARLILGAVAMAGLAGCTGTMGLSTPGASASDASSRATGDPTAVASEPASELAALLLTSRSASGPRMEASVAGELGISSEGCVTVAGFVLVAPPGSTIIGIRVHLASITDAVIGDSIAASGGLIDVEAMPAERRPDGYERCGATELAVISAP